MKNKILISSFLFLASIHSYAAKVVQVNADTVVISTEELKTENAKSFVIDLGQGEQCIASLKSSQEGHLLLDTKSCANKDKIRAGQTVANAIVFAEQPVVQKPEPPAKESSVGSNEELKHKARKFNFALTPSAVLSGNLTFPAVTILEAGTLYFGTVMYNLDPGLSLRLDATQSDQNSYNLAFGLGIEGSRNLGKATSTLNGTAYNGNGFGKVSTSYIFGGFSYRWETYFIGLGLLATNVTSDGLPPAVKNLKGGIGADFYMGWYLEDNIAIELSSKSTSVTTETFTSGSTTIKLDTGYMSSISLGVKFLFL